MRSTPTPFEILRTVKVSLTPRPRRAMQTPFERLETFLVPFLDPHIDAQRVTRPERRQLSPAATLFVFR